MRRPETSNTQTRGTGCWIQSRSVPSPVSASDVTFITLYIVDALGVPVPLDVAVATCVGVGATAVAVALTVDVLAGVCVGLLVEVGVIVDVAVTVGVEVLVYVNVGVAV